MLAYSYGQRIANHAVCVVIRDVLFTQVYLHYQCLVLYVQFVVSGCCIQSSKTPATRPVPLVKNGHHISQQPSQLGQINKA